MDESNKIDKIFEANLRAAAREIVLRDERREKAFYALKKLRTAAVGAAAVAVVVSAVFLLQRAVNRVPDPIQPAGTPGTLVADNSPSLSGDVSPADFEVIPLDGLLISPSAREIRISGDPPEPVGRYKENELPIFFNDGLIKDYYAYESDGKVYLPVKVVDEIFKGTDAYTDHPLGYGEYYTASDSDGGPVVSIYVSDGIGRIGEWMISGAKHVIISMTNSDNIIDKNKAVYLFRDTLIKSYERRYGAFEPLEEQPDLSSDTEVYRYLITKSYIYGENDDYYFFFDDYSLFYSKGKFCLSKKTGNLYLILQEDIGSDISFMLADPDLIGIVDDDQANGKKSEETKIESDERLELYERYKTSIYRSEYDIYEYTGTPEPLSEETISEAKERLAQYLTDDYLTEKYKKAYKQRTGSELYENTAPCAEHDFRAFDPDHPDAGCSAVVESPDGWHIKAYRREYVCGNCGAARWDEEIEYIIEPHSFIYWIYSGDESHSDESGEHIFRYESNCSVCMQYAVKDVRVPCSGGDDHAYVDKYGDIQNTADAPEEYIIEFIPMKNINIISSKESGGRNEIQYFGGSSDDPVIMTYDDDEVSIFINEALVKDLSAKVSDGKVYLPEEIVSYLFSDEGGEDFSSFDTGGRILHHNVRTGLDIDVQYWDLYMSKNYLVPGIRQVMISVVGETPIRTADQAEEFFRERMIMAYDNIYGGFEPLYDEPDPYDEKEYLKYRITTCGVSMENDTFYVINFPWENTWQYYIGKYTDNIYRVYQGEAVNISLFDPTSPYALSYAG